MILALRFKMKVLLCVRLDDLLHMSGHILNSGLINCLP